MTLKNKTFLAVRATTASYTVRFALQLIQIAILARLLAPSDFGAMAIVSSFLVVLTIVADFGISRSLIHFREISDQARTSLYWLNIFLAVSLALLLAIISPAVAWFYKEPSLSYALALGGLLFPLTALGQQFLVMAEKELSFSKLAVIEIISATLGLFIAVTFALNGAGIYALVLGTLTVAAAKSIMALGMLSQGWRPAWHFNIQEVRPMLKFGAYLVGENAAGALHRELDVIIGGLMVGAAPLGLYSLARNVALRLANTVVNPIVTRVGFPVMAHVQHDSERLRVIYLSILRMVSSVNFPMYIMLLVFADDIVHVLYGPGWSQAVPYLQVLAIWGLIRSTGNPVGGLIVASGRARLALLWNMALLVITPLWLLGGIWLEGGLSGLVWAMIGLQLIIFIPVWRWLVYPLCGATLSNYLNQLYVPIIVSVISGGVSLLVIFPIEMYFLRLCLGGLVFSSCYLFLSYQFNRLWIDAMLKLLRPVSSITVRF